MLSGLLPEPVGRGVYVHLRGAGIGVQAFDREGNTSETKQNP
jgi:hypothetical protein